MKYEPKNIHEMKTPGLFCHGKRCGFLLGTESADLQMRDGWKSGLLG